MNYWRKVAIGVLTRNSRIECYNNRQKRIYDGDDIDAAILIGLALNKELLFHESYSFSVCNQDFKHMLIIIDYYTNDDQKIIDEFIQRYRKVKSRPLSKSDKEMIRVIKHALHSFSKTIEKWISQNDDSSPFTIKIY